MEKKNIPVSFTLNSDKDSHIVQYLDDKVNIQGINKSKFIRNLLEDRMKQENYSASGQ